VKDYVRLRKLSQREMFVPLEHPPGDAQADFGEAMVVIAGVERKAHYLVMDLPQSDDCFVMAFPAETTEAFLEGHTSNLPFNEWTEAFGSERLTGALLDRLTHHVHILEMNGESYRLKDSKRRRSAKPRS